MNIIQGEFASANSHNALTLAAPTPTNISLKSEPHVLMKGTFASFAIAFANNVLPVPAGP